MVATLFHSALEALMHHDSVRTLNGGSRQRTAVREHNDAEALCGASWYKVQQRWQAYVTHDGRKFHLGWYQHEEHAAKVRDLMAIKLRGVHTPLNFVPETYSDMYELLAQVDQVLLLELLQSFSRTWKKLLVESARQQQRMTCEAATEASDPTMGTDTEDAAPIATNLSCQPSHPLTPHSAAGCGMAMGNDVATRFDAALDELLLHASVRAPSNVQRQKHNDAGDFCGAVWSKANQHWRAQVSHNGRNLYLGCFQDEEHAAKVHDLMAIKLRGMHTALNFVPETYSDIYELLAQVDQALLLELLQAFSRTRNKLLVESARQQQRMALEAALEASDPTMGTDTEDATPTATTLPCQPSPPLASHSTAGCGMPIMGDDVATRFGSALEAVLSHASVRVPSDLNRLTPGRQHNGAGDFCGTGWDETSRRWKAGVSHHGRRFYLGCYQHEEHAAKVHDLMAIKLRGLHTPLNFVSKTYNGMYDLLAQVDQALLVELLLSFSRTRNKLLAESARQQKRITPKAALEASDLTMSTDGEDSSNKAQLSHHGRKVYLGCFQHEEHAAKVHDLMAIKLRGMHTPLNFVPETYNDMYELLAQVEQPLLLELLRAYNRKNKKLLAEAGRQQGSTIQKAALTAPDPAMHPDLSDASSPTATTLPRQAGQPPAPPSAAAPGEAQCSVEALGWPCDAAGSEAPASLPPSKRPRRPAMALIGSAPLGSSAQGTSTRRCPSAAAACADTTASNSNALGMTLPAAPQLVGAPGVSLGVSKGRARPASRGWAEADALWEQAEQVHEGGGGDGEAMLPGSSHATAEQDCDAQENNQVSRLLPDAGSNVWYADSSEWGPRQVEADVAGHALSGQYTRAVEEEAWEGPPAMNPVSWSPSIQATGQPAVSGHRQRLQRLLSQQRCAAPSECAASAAASWDD
ncbi:hypothetical protein V8C86DRAFT_969944 [Haematococcus lacustris]